MSLKIEEKIKEEYIITSFRLPKELFSQIEVISTQKGISKNKLVILSLKYALEEIE